MTKLDIYDLAAHDYYTKNEAIGLPLISWDFYQCTVDKLYKEGNDMASLQQLANKNKWTFTPQLQNNIKKRDHVVVVTNPNLEIVHVSQNIFIMNGYHPAEVLGQKPKMFQGKDTCKVTSEYIGSSVRENKPFEAVILNYRKDGSPYRCWITGEPVFDTSGELINFIAFEKEIA